MNWIKIYTTLFLILKFGSTYAQVNEKELSKIPFKKLYMLYFENSEKKDLQKRILKTYYNKAIQSDSSINKARYYYMRLQSETPKQAISSFDSVIKYSLNTGDKSFPFAAYREKAYKHIQLYQYDKAIQSFTKAENHVRNKDWNLYYKIRLDVAIFKSEELGNVKEALEIYKECYKYSKKQKWDGNTHLYLNNTILFCLADAYKTLKVPDSSSFYNRLGYKSSVLIKNDIMKNLFTLNEGANLISKKNYKTALDSIKIALPKVIALKDTDNTMAGYFYRGKAYEGLGNKSLAVKNFTLVDSMYQKSKYIFPEVVDGYPFLVNYYKESGNKEMHIKYLTALISVDSLMNKKFRNFDKIIHKNYEIPHLLKEKEDAIQDLESRYSIALYCVALFIIAVLALFWYNGRQKEIYKKRFDALILKLNEPTPVIDNNEEKSNHSTKEIIIADEVINSILKKLQEFEKKKGYLDSTLNMQFLADQFDTNTKYLSKIINEQKQVNFVQYINDLRIDYALKKLQNNSKLRKYTLIALANEFGFNTAESFSNAFFRKTGIKPSYYLKELNNTNN
ncbi:helix-turn-helix domain-containing protein [Flavobacterium amniphilum]|uniref:helix-turn-helix domain-containing protein n=1 Tax=Flavobacterium amniphilum TaxID=1834035 RepID=UPI00202AA4B5|nr:helix-turn-helix domain-containing protein [Flavobacterium amniphilum]MCL9805028.1 helix-turn-helix domain-containing protein [Flavobacterium amniphilum]